MALGRKILLDASSTSASPTDVVIVLSAGVIFDLNMTRWRIWSNTLSLLTIKIRGLIGDETSLDDSVVVCIILGNTCKLCWVISYHRLCMLQSIAPDLILESVQKISYDKSSLYIEISAIVVRVMLLTTRNHCRGKCAWIGDMPILASRWRGGVNHSLLRHCRGLVNHS